MKLKIKKSRILPQTHQDGYYIKKNVSKNVEKKFPGSLSLQKEKKMLSHLFDWKGIREGAV